MNSRTCYAMADTLRAAIALAAPFAAIGAAILAMGREGYNMGDYPALLSSGHLSWFRQAAGWLALATWTARYFPPAWAALWDGPCLVSSDSQNLFLPRVGQISLASITRVTVRREFFRKAAYIDTTEGCFTVSLLFVRSASDQKLRGLSPSRMTTV